MDLGVEPFICATMKTREEGGDEGLGISSPGQKNEALRIT